MGSIGEFGDFGIIGNLLSQLVQKQQARSSGLYISMKLAGSRISNFLLFVFMTILVLSSEKFKEIGYPFCNSQAAKGLYSPSWYFNRYTFLSRLAAAISWPFFENFRSMRLFYPHSISLGTNSSQSCLIIILPMSVPTAMINPPSSRDKEAREVIL